MIERNDRENLKTLLTKVEPKPDVNIKDKNGIPLLVMFTRKEDVEMVNILLNAKADVDAHVDYSDTALISAAKDGFSNLVKVLLDAKANPNIHDKNWNRSTALYHAVAMEDTTSTELLLEAKAEVNSENNRKETPLHNALKNQHKVTANLLLEAKANVNMQDNDYNTPLMLSVYDTELFTKAMTLQPIDKINIDRALQRAAWIGKEDVVKILLAIGASMEEKNINGDTALSYAAQRAEINTVKILLEAKANVNSQNHREMTALSHASEGWFNDTVEGYFETVKLLLATGKTDDASKGLALCYAAKNNHVDIMKLLLEAKAPINYLDSCGDTPLLIAARHGQKSAITLIEAKADVNIKNNAGNTALIEAILSYRYENQAEIIKSLRAHGASVYIKNAKGQTPLEIASSEKPFFDWMREALIEPVQSKPLTSTQHGYFNHVLSFNSKNTSTPEHEIKKLKN